MSLADAKSDARKAAFARRKAAHAALGSTDRTGPLQKVLTAYEGRTISAYMPIHSEIDPRPAMHAVSPRSQIVLPVIEGKGRPLSFRVWTPGCAMVTGAFGAEIPAEAAPATPEILIVPMVAFDADLYRLGYGGGFYDRTLAQLRARGPVIAIGFAYSGQQAATLPRDATDEPVDMLVTEAGVLYPA